MKRFDLTFCGNVVEEFEVDQVKRSMGILLDLAEPTQLDNLFRGGNYILGQNLVRKSAAEMFRKLTSVGAQVELVPRGRTPADAQVLHSAFALAHTAPPPKPIHSTDRKSRKALQNASVALHNAANQSDSNTAKTSQPSADPAPKIQIELHRELRKQLRELQSKIEDTKRLARIESAKLQHRLDHFERIAQNNFLELDKEKENVSDDSVSRVEELEESIMHCQEQVENKVAQLQERERSTAQQTKLETDRLHGLIIETEDEEQSALEQLDQAKDEIRCRTDVRIQALRAEIEELETLAQSELDTIEQQANDHLNNWNLERVALENEQEEIQRQNNEQLEWLAQQQQMAISESQTEIASIQQARDDIREARKDTLIALQERERENEKRLQRNLRRAHHADEIAREKSKLALQELHAKKLELQRQIKLAMSGAKGKTPQSNPNEQTPSNRSLRT